jgi:hypothetical protein
MRFPFGLALGLLALGCSPAPLESKPPVTPAAKEVRAPAAAPAPTDSVDDELEEVLRSDPDLAAFLDDAPRRRLQVLVAIPTETPEGKPVLRRLGFRADAEYFYPASSVKLCAAVAALDKLEDLRADGRRQLGLDTRVRFTEGEGTRRKVVETTIRAELEKALILSDNDAHNRLFDFVGREELAERMSRLGLRSVRLVHPIGAPSTRQGPPVIELLPSGWPIVVAQRVGFELPPPPAGDTVLVGSAHVDENGKLVQRPMDFSSRNSVTLRDLQDLLVSVVRPDAFDGPPPRISQDREDLLTILGRLPTDLKQVREATKGQGQVVDDMFKPLHGAIVRTLPGDRIRVLGKGGRAYGFAVENVYALDETTGRSFFAAATIHANDDDVMNDDKYDYDNVATPFILKLGAVLARSFLVGPPAR